MAVKSDKALRKAEADAEVSNCVCNLIEAFTNGLNIFKRLRERRRKRKARKEAPASDPTSDAEHQLSKSLRKGPEEIALKYAECYHSGMGPRFAKGDSIAHASLAETLIKLNTGLVGIITTFLNHDPKSGKGQLNLDYKSLTHLSDSSRKEALQSMTELYVRLSQSQMNLRSIAAPKCARCGSIDHAECSSQSATSSKAKKRTSTSRQRSSGPVVTRMPIKSSAHPQLVVVRPKTGRRSSHSGKDSSSKQSPSSSTNTSPLTSPLPLYVPVNPLEVYGSSTIKGTLGAPPPIPSSRRVDSFDISHTPKWQDFMIAPEHLHAPVPKLPSFTPAPKRSLHHEKMKASAVPAQPSYPPPPPPAVAPAISLPMRRRLDKMTNSSYTFASDSTKLGEIPQRNWTKPWDYEEADRLNAEAAVSGPPAVATEEKVSRRRGAFRKFIRRGSAAGAA